ncbi:chemotaxis protein CheX [Brevundimonas sp. GN22]|uniref:STAS domain-containing protein n=1 Tax=Brevundimonas pishanensis TaxID=2896315 RepID=UPI001FA6E342|nr:STAS domain-containing protein [Brevundimonas pishanensis]
MSPTPGDSAIVSLPAVIDLRTVEQLKADLMAQRGHPVALDASSVERVGGLGVQLLLSAIKTWQADGKSLTFINVSNAMNEQWLSFGSSPLELAQDAA